MAQFSSNFGEQSCYISVWDFILVIWVTYHMNNLRITLEFKEKDKIQVLSKRIVKIYHSNCSVSCFRSGILCVRWKIKLLKSFSMMGSQLCYYYEKMKNMIRVKSYPRKSSTRCFKFTKYLLIWCRSTFSPLTVMEGQLLSCKFFPEPSKGITIQILFLKNVVA